ncbi:uncharacterized protein PGTG_08460 [Puccinia graminis f. sp. tritici CRL 75-36-700-3]|uniref:Uncharacterized protein n=1 Tax=Puccinia graminis f. sp. tritici (strain CRL 75-36-700-3 / race SCCL) TaxID=418459 RepID=E3KDR8_PUCGT|nr:uncharacterized protein PGTG_08460 [Puccinia graminis f. sp. tritici CRL 75-36-700-3]EFP82504.2 hypothetical protein PGTG_08460 [Puccinia graminis f. sp. tritici CRL 75-36-700-3]
MSEELALPPTAIIQACRPYFSTINIQDSMNIYVSVVMKKTQSLKIDRPIKKNGPDDDLGCSRFSRQFGHRSETCSIPLGPILTSLTQVPSEKQTFDVSVISARRPKWNTHGLEVGRWLAAPLA